MHTAMHIREARHSIYALFQTINFADRYIEIKGVSAAENWYKKYISFHVVGARLAATNTTEVRPLD